MLAMLGAPPTGDEWSIEWKFDGQRALILAEDDMTVFSRNGADITRTFPEVAAMVSAAVGDRRIILDGEIVALDTGGRPSFTRLQRRWPQQRRPSAQLLREVPVRFYAFDILAVEDRDVTVYPYARRRDLLEELAAAASGLLVLPRFASRALPAADLLKIAAENGIEGIVSKRLDSPYRAGVRSSDWIKTCHRLRSEFLIGGWLPGQGPRRDAISALLVGAHDSQGRLRFCGAVGSGLSSAHRRTLQRILEPLGRATSPFDDQVPAVIARQARWVHAEAVGDVEYREMTGVLRHPSWKGLRADLDDIARIVLPEPTAETG
jgi:bifunctional non-homologous end joining protein LigD